MKTFIFSGLLAAFACRLPAQVAPQNAALYVTTQTDGARPDSGFDFYLAAVLRAKHVPVTIVTDKSKADYELDWKATALPQSKHSYDEASIELVNLATSQVVFAFSVDRNNSPHGRQAAAESCAKHLLAAMQKTWPVSQGKTGKVSAKRAAIWSTKDPALDF